MAKSIRVGQAATLPEAAGLWNAFGRELEEAVRAIRQAAQTDYNTAQHELEPDDDLGYRRLLRLEAQRETVEELCRRLRIELETRVVPGTKKLVALIGAYERFQRSGGGVPVAGGQATRKNSAEAAEAIVRSLIPDSYDRYLREAETALVAAGESIPGLLPAEKVMLRYYTGVGYIRLNETLWADSGVFVGDLKWSDEERNSARQAAAVLDSALDHLPDYRAIVTRYEEHMSEEQFARLQPGQFVRFAGFSSGSHTGPIARDSPRSFIIHPRHGKKIDFVSAHRGEREVLFKHGTWFHVLDRRERGGKIEIELEEIEK